MGTALWLSVLLLSLPVSLSQQDGQQQAPGASINHLIDRAECAADIRKYCQKQVDATPKDQLSDITVLECLQDAGYSDTETISPACEQAVWEVKVALTQDDRFIAALNQFCAADMAKFAPMAKCAKETGKGRALSCMLDHFHQLNKNEKCYQFLSRVESIAFADFRLVGTFIEQCGVYVTQLNCGSLTRQAAHQNVKVPHSQGATMECFVQKLVNIPKDPAQAEIVRSVSEDCRHEVMRIAELQQEDFHLDRPLFFACRADRERFCSEVPAGEGKVFQCLLEHKDDKLMEPECSVMLAERAGLIGQDAKLAHPLLNACEAEMKASGCALQPGYRNSQNFHLTWLLLCLENGLHTQKQQEYALSHNQPLPPDQTKLAPYSAQCTHELVTFRGLMIQEFRMSPELVMACAKEIDGFCSPHGDIEVQGKTMHCLMEHAQMRNEKYQIGPQCFAALQQVVKAADIANNYRVDKVLYASCRPLIDGKCKMDAVSEAGTFSCLMRHLDADDMSDECEKRLVEVQYFMARDWTLDPQLYDSCHKEAVERCSALDNWHLQNNARNQVDPGPQVLACLYRAGYDEEHPLSPECAGNVHRVLRTRAVRVNLIPDIEANCREALSEFCSNNVQPQEEMNCLQSHFEENDFRKRYPRCYTEVYKFTSLESKDTKLNRLLTRACSPVIDRYCSNLANEEIDHGDVMECLARNKNQEEMTPKCRSYVHHFELISMRDYHFSYRFSQACEGDVKQYCSAFGQDKGAVIRCLSNIVFEHKVLGEKADLSKDCKKQLKVAYFQQEQVDFDDKEHMSDAAPTLMKKCQRDIQKLKCDTESTFKGVVECLRVNFEVLDPECKALVFEREKVQAVDNTFDQVLVQQCQFDIRKFCGGTTEGDSAIRCLSNSKIIRVLQPGCQQVVRERLREQAKDDRLRPSLLQACEADAKTLCANEVSKLHGKQYNAQQIGNVISACLREQIARNGAYVSAPCRSELSLIILEAEFDIQVDPMLYKACRDTISRHCSNKIVSEGGRFETVLECLKADFYTNQIQDQECNRQLTRVTQEALVDIHLDPSLFEACSVDAQRLCRDVPPGQSRIITCLIDSLNVPQVQMSEQCKTKLVERQKLWNVAHEAFKMALPKSFAAAYEAIATHPERDSILTYFGGAIVLLLLIGCCFGRCTKRTHHELKNR